jgi:hypothetical protein
MPFAQEQVPAMAQSLSSKLRVRILSLTKITGAENGASYWSYRFRAARTNPSNSLSRVVMTLVVTRNVQPRKLL